MKKILKKLKGHIFGGLTSIQCNYGKNNRLIVLDDNGQESKTKYVKNLKIKFKGDNNTIKLYKKTKFSRVLNITCTNNNLVKIGKTTFPLGLSITRMNENNVIEIGDNAHIVHCNITCHDEKNLKVSIGDSCLMSGGITIRTSDGHSILDKDNNIINYPENIKIGNHCWIGMNSTILKGADIPDNSVLACSTVYTKASNTGEGNAIYGGIPAKVIKRDINWDIRNTDILKDVDVAKRGLPH